MHVAYGLALLYIVCIVTEQDDYLWPTSTVYCRCKVSFVPVLRKYCSTVNVFPVWPQVSLPTKHVTLHELVLSEVEQALHDAIFQECR